MCHQLVSVCQAQLRFPRDGGHTSLLALIERRFLTLNGVTQQLTKHDQYANALEDMFDFENAPSLDTQVTVAAPPAKDCTLLKLP